MNDLDKLIHRYISEAHNQLILADEPKTHKVVYIVSSKRDNLIEAVNKIESGQIFHDLVELTRQEYDDNDFFKKYYESDGRSLVSNFFRRSGSYLEWFNNIKVDAHALCRKYHDAFQKRYVTTRYLVPLGLVGFPGYEFIDFGSFKIRRFTEEQLNDITNNSINEIFYPNSVWNGKKLSLLWFLEILCKKEIKEINVNYDYDYKIMPNFLEHPEEVNYALYNLLLFDWEKVTERVWDEGDRWDGFEIPFVSKFDDNLIDYPKWAPDLSIIYNICPKEWDDPLLLFEFLDEETILNFKDFVQRNQKLLDEKLFNTWPFLRTAFEYLKKAFFTRSYPNAPEQLLWHITSIEALLAEPKKSITRLLKDRLSHILGETKNERKRIRDEFNKIYDIRCDLVHGNPWQEGLSYKYLLDARNFARETCLWFIYFLSILKNKVTDDADIPSRNDILSFIDLHGLGKNSIKSIKLLLAHAPNKISLKNLL
jgi:hypothetical protein